MARVILFCLIFLTALLAPGPGRAAAAIDQGRCYDVTGGENPCAGTGQDGDSQTGIAWPEPRFADNGDGTVTDNLTGLVWLKDAGCLGRADQSGAREIIRTLNNGNADYGCEGLQGDNGNWRLPEVRELESLTNIAAPDQAAWLTAAGFVNVQAGGYWSATPAASAYNGWFLDLTAGAVDYAPRISARNIWPVHGAGAGAGTRGNSPPEEPHRPRFEVNGDGTVTDLETGLDWLQNAGAYAGLTWPEALARVAGLAAGGKTSGGWRLPNRRELQSLLDYRRDDPALPPDAPFTGLAASPYWTSSTTAGSPAQAWTVHPVYGESRPLGKLENAAAWPVRTRTAPTSLLAQTADWRRHRKNQDSRLPHEAVNLSLPRFTPQADGTVTDNLTGLMWLADGDCLGKVSWREAREALARLNGAENQFKCEGYTASYRDWLLPGPDQLQELQPPTATDAVGWLNAEGFRDVQPQGYWTASASRTNVYYAWLFNLRMGEKRSYPKDFRFFLLPYRSPR